MTGDESTGQTELLVLDGAVEPDQVEIDVAGGSAFAVTIRDPEKETVMMAAGADDFMYLGDPPSKLVTKLRIVQADRL